MLVLISAVTWVYGRSIVNREMVKFHNDTVQSNARVALMECEKSSLDLKTKHQSDIESLMRQHEQNVSGLHQHHNTRYDNLDTKCTEDERNAKQKFENAKTIAEDRFNEVNVANEQTLKSMLEKTEEYVSSFQEYVTSVRTFIDMIGPKCKNSKFRGHMHGENNRLLIGMAMHTMTVDPSCESLSEIKNALIRISTKSVKYSEDMKELHKNSNIEINFNDLFFGEPEELGKPEERVSSRISGLFSSLLDGHGVLAVAATGAVITAFTGFYWVFKMSMPIQHSKRDAVVNRISVRSHIKHRI